MLTKTVFFCIVESIADNKNPGIILLRKLIKFLFFKNQIIWGNKMYSFLPQNYLKPNLWLYIFPPKLILFNHSISYESKFCLPEFSS